jgi:hypothetical protein
MVGVFLAAILATSCHKEEPAYHRSSDGQTESIYVLPGIALFRHLERDPAKGGSPRFDLAQAKPGDEPSDPSITRDTIEKLLVQDIAGICLINAGDEKFLLLSGYAPIDEQSLSFDQVVQITKSRKKQVVVVGANRVVFANTASELTKAFDEKTLLLLNEAKLANTQDFFDGIRN